MSEPTSTVLLLHSTATWPSMWHPYVDLVRPLGMPVLPVHVGYPPNPPIPRGVTATVFDDVQAVVDQLRAAAPGEGPVHLVTHSYGGMVGIMALAQLGARVQSVLLYEPTLFMALSTDADADDAARADLAYTLEHFRYDDEQGGREQWLAYFIAYWNRPGAWQRLPDAQRDATRAIGWKMFQEAKSVFSVDALQHGDLSAVPVVTVVDGERTRDVSRGISATLLRRYPHAAHITVPGTGHMGPLTHPIATREAVAAHVARVLATPALHAMPTGAAPVTTL
jgi:pimeloyl-ACP methyl ester carboxylesterase